MDARAATPPEHPSPHKERVGTIGLLTGLAAGPAAWALQLVVGYGLSSYACFPRDQPHQTAPPPGWGGEHVLLLALNLLCAALCLAGMGLAWANWRRSREEKAGDHHVLPEVGEGRTRFLAGCGVVTSAGFTLAILFDTAPILGTPSCWNIPS